jgi:small subunit ribosomal protein S19
MGRSVAKGPYITERLLQKVDKMERSGRKEAIRTWARGSTVVPQFVGYTFSIHNGRKFIPVYITESMVGHKFGEFSPTRTFRAHSGKRSEKAGKALK